MSDVVQEKQADRWVPLWHRTVFHVLVIVAVSLCIRMIYLEQISQNPFFFVPVVDASVYDTQAQQLAQGEPMSATPFFQPPLYPAFLGGLYKIFGRDLKLARLIQMLIGVLNGVLVYFLARRLLPSLWAFAAGLTMSATGTMLFFEGELLAPVLIVFWNLCMFLVADRFIRHPSKIAAFLVGALLGLSAITMAVVLPFGAVLLAAGLQFLKKKKYRRSKRLLFSVLFIAGAAAPILPVTAYNASRGEAVLISWNGGLNFYLGAGPNYVQKVQIRPGYQWQKLVDEPIEHGLTMPGEQSRYFYKKGLGEIGDAPVASAVAILRKLLDVVNGHEILRNQSIYPFRRYSPLLSALVWKRGVYFPYGLLFPLAMLGAIGALGRKQNLWNLMVVFVATHIVVLLLFFVTARYRMNILPFLVILATWGCRYLWLVARQRQWRKAVFPSIVLAISLLLANIQLKPEASDFGSDAWYNLGVALYQDEQYDAAYGAFVRSHQRDPAVSGPQIYLAVYDTNRGTPARAIDRLRVVLASEPNNVYAHVQMGFALKHQQRYDAAIAHFKKVQQLEPDHKEAARQLRILVQRVK